MDTNAVPPRRGAPSTTSTISAAVSAVPVDELAAPVGVSFAVADQVLAALVVASLVQAFDVYSTVVDADNKTIRYDSLLLRYKKYLPEMQFTL